MYYNMSKVYYSQPKTPYDEEQAYQRHLAYLKTQSAISQQFQDAYRNELLGVPPTTPTPPTATEVLENQLELDKATQKYLRMLVPDVVRPKPFNDLEEDMTDFVKRTQPAKYIFENMTQPEKILLVQNFPAIQTELKNYQFIDADFLLEYLAKYREAFQSTGGVSRLNRTNIALGEITAVLETMGNYADLRRLEDEIKTAINRSRETTRGTLDRRVDRLLRKIDELKNAIPSNEDIAASLDTAVQLGQESVMEGREMTDTGVIDKLVKILEKLPTAERLEQLTLGFKNIAEGREGTAETPILEALTATEEEILKYPPQFIAKLVETSNLIKAENIGILREEGKAPPARRGRPKKQPVEEPAKSKSQSIEKFFGRRERERETQPIELDLPEVVSSSGFGSNITANRFKHRVHPKFTAMVGKGLSIVEEEPTYVEFGKLALSKKHLNKGQLSVRSLKSGQQNPAIPTCEVSEDFVDILENFLQTEKLNERALKKLDQKEKKLFSTLLNKSGLYGKYKMKVAKTDDEVAEEERFNLVKGEIIAGNDNPEIVKELKRFLMKFVMEGRIPKREAHELLFQLTYI